MVPIRFTIFRLVIQWFGRFRSLRSLTQGFDSGLGLRTMVMAPPVHEAIGDKLRPCNRVSSFMAGDGSGTISRSHSTVIHAQGSASLPDESQRLSTLGIGFPPRIHLTAEQIGWELLGCGCVLPYRHT